MGLTPSTNFAFLARHEEGLVLLASQAELLFSVEPVASIGKVRAFAELLALETAARVGLYTSKDEAQIDRLRRLRDRGVVTGEADTAFHSIRKAGNAAVHDKVGDFSTAFHCIKLAYSLAVWFERSFREARTFTADSADRRFAALNPEPNACPGRSARWGASRRTSVATIQRRREHT